MVAYRQQPNIRNKLIHTDHIRVTKQKNNDQNRKCNRSRCKACKHFTETTVFTNKINGRFVNIKTGGTCTTANCVYAITCDNCHQVYIGQTGRSIAERLAGHRSDIKQFFQNNEKRVETAEHFAMTNHKTYTITILEHHNNWTLEDRLLAEDYYMSRLRTIHPEGMNKRHGDLVKYFYNA